MTHLLRDADEFGSVFSIRCLENQRKLTCNECFETASWQSRALIFGDSQVRITAGHFAQYNGCNFTTLLLCLSWQLF